MDARGFQRLVLRVTHWIGSAQSIAIHTALFAASFATVFLGLIGFDRMLLVLTTIVSLEAIYLSLFIQLTVNLQGQSLKEVEQDIDEIQEDIDEIQEDVEEMQEDVEEMTEDDDARTLGAIHDGLRKLIEDVERLRQKGN